MRCAKKCADKTPHSNSWLTSIKLLFQSLAWILRTACPENLCRGHWKRTHRAEPKRQSCREKGRTEVNLPLSYILKSQRVNRTSIKLKIHMWQIRKVFEIFPFPVLPVWVTSVYLKLTRQELCVLRCLLGSPDPPPLRVSDVFAQPEEASEQEWETSK